MCTTYERDPLALLQRRGISEMLLCLYLLDFSWHRMATKLFQQVKEDIIYVRSFAILPGVLYRGVRRSGVILHRAFCAQQVFCSLLCIANLLLID